MTLVGANANAKVTGMNPLPGKSNYFLGNDPKKWRTNVPTYAKVKYKGVYPGIDLVYYGNQRQLEYDFVVAPGADPRAIAFEIDGAVAPVSSPAKKSAMGTSPLQIDPSGDLVISAGAGELRFHKPVVYQPNPESRNPNPGFSTDNGRPTTDRSFNLQSSIINPLTVVSSFSPPTASALKSPTMTNRCRSSSTPC